MSILYLLPTEFQRRREPAAKKSVLRFLRKRQRIPRCRVANHVHRSHANCSHIILTVTRPRSKSARRVPKGMGRKGLYKTIVLGRFCSGRPSFGRAVSSTHTISDVRVRKKGSELPLKFQAPPPPGTLVGTIGRWKVYRTVAGIGFSDPFGPPRIVDFLQ